MNKSLGHSTKTWSSRTYNSWRAMIARCQNPNHQKYRIYGARGIKVCPRWNEFAEFLADMGEAPEGCTLDRIDNDADYSPANCRWSTQHTQQRNRRNNVRYTLNGVSAPLSTWCEQFDIPYSTAQNRLRNGVSIERALTKGRLASRVQPPDGTTERDAARYRWLRDVAWNTGMVEVMGLRYGPEEWDAYIDRALGEAVCAELSGRSARSDSKEPSKSSSIQAESPSADRGTRGPCKEGWCQSAVDNGDPGCAEGECDMANWPRPKHWKPKVEGGAKP